MYMRKLLKKYYLPHDGNEFKPHFLRELNVTVLACIILLLVGFSFFYSHVLLQGRMLGAILPGVLVDLTNIDRGSNSQYPLKMNPVLAEVARMKAEDMANKGYFAHTSPEGLSPWHWFKKAGYSFTHAGENLAVDFVDSTDVERAWMESAGHRANILNQNFSEIGIATAKGMYQGRETMFVVQMFGNPAKPVASALHTALVSAPDVSPRTPAPAAAPIAPSSVSTMPALSSETPIKGEESDASNAEPVAIAESGEKNSMFLAVKNAEPLVSGQPTAGIASGAGSYLFLFKRLVTSPKLLVQIVYLIIAIQAILTLVLMIWVEAHQKHPRHALYGIFLLVLIVSSFYLVSSFLPEIAIT
ncbi:MAG: hypothetical protein A2676_03310 [Candidatus Sungbacteria bacterium RIFCSPHIGHO2_01_FULL_51_22]|nr:MAG: hypothetical protein A2676_03310 [Candidatus Sungbacteria bacterium RIFCSPHIGHO2_01_FULL_51_22]